MPTEEVRRNLGEALRRIKMANKEKNIELDLSRLQLNKIPAELLDLTHLKNLDLSFNQIINLPERLGRLCELEVLDLSFNKLSSLPVSIGKLKSLLSLDIRNNNLTFLPDEIGNLKSLKNFDLKNNQLTLIPDSIERLTSLNGTLSLRQNNLKELPFGVGRLRGITVLDLSHNNIKEIPESIGDLSILSSLDLSHNQIKELPVCIGNLCALKSLDLISNKLIAIPEKIKNLTHLSFLDLRNNKLTELPADIGNLKALNSLNLSNNQLKKIPASIGDLLSLSSLDLSNNELVEIPESLRRIEKLRQLFFHGNEALKIPAEVLGPNCKKVLYDSYKAANPKDILDYYFRIIKGKKPLNEAKLILVGRGGAGKTSIINRLVNGIFDPDSKKTEGIKIDNWQIEINGSEKIMLNIWDFGGQEIMHATHQFFMTERSLYLLVVNGRPGNEDRDAEYWLSLIESFGDEVPVIIVLNKINEHQFDLNERALRQKYIGIKKIIKTDCEDATGFADLQNEVFKQINDLPHLRDSFPASWFSIKDELTSMQDNYLSFEKFQEICSKYEENDDEAQKQLSRYLHDLGIALNYRDDPRLNHTHILNPHWVTNGIYGVINSKKLADQKGEIRLEELSDILDSKIYPSNMRNYLFDLMKKFELCFSFPDNDSHFLVPELLDKQEPEAASVFEPKECLNFRYHYDGAFPEGIIPRFIVRTHTLSDNGNRWRTGVILKFEGCEALVKADVQDKKIFISVKGNDGESRRRLLAVIRSDFERIHGGLKALKVQEMVPLPEYPDVVVLYNKLILWGKKGKLTMEIEIGEDIIEVNVKNLLHGVDMEGAVKRTDKDVLSKPISLFYSYSHKDEVFKDQLETHLKLLKRLGIIYTWSDREITAGEEWKDQIDENLKNADVILLLVSSDFIASDYCYEKEMKLALERHDKKEGVVIPVIIRDVSWAGAPFAKIQALPKDGHAVDLWRNKDSAWKNVSEGIKMAVGRIRGNNP